jgi:hypothetical protein
MPQAAATPSSRTLLPAQLPSPRHPPQQQRQHVPVVAGRGWGGWRGWGVARGTRRGHGRVPLFPKFALLGSSPACNAKNKRPLKGVTASGTTWRANIEVLRRAVLRDFRRRRTFHGACPTVSHSHVHKGVYPKIINSSTTKLGQGHA